MENNFIRNEITYIEPIPENTGLVKLFDIFKRCKLNDIFPVLNSSNQPIGLVRECDFKEFVYSPYGKDILLSRSLKKELKSFVCPCPCVEIEDSLDTIMENYSLDESSNHEGVIITNQGQYAGFLTSSAILKIVNRRNLKIKQLESINKVAVTAGDQINTPLGVIIGRASMIGMLMNYEDSDISKNLTVIKEQAYRIKKTVDAIKNIKNIQDKEYKLDDLKMLDLSNLQI